MKLLLKHSIRSLGRAGEVVNVKNGYARNYLLPQGKAIPATESNVALIGKYKARRTEEEALLKAAYKELQVAINETSLVLNLRANEGNYLYGSFSAGDVVTQLNNRHINVEKSMVDLEDPIKALGQYEITINLDSEFKATLKVDIQNEHGEIPAVEEDTTSVLEEEKQDTEESDEETSQVGESSSENQEETA